MARPLVLAEARSVQDQGKMRKRKIPFSLVFRKKGGVEGRWFIWLFWIFLTEVTLERQPHCKKMRRAKCPSATLKDDMSFNVLPLCPHDMGFAPARDLICLGKWGESFSLLWGYPKHQARLRGWVTHSFSSLQTATLFQLVPAPTFFLFERQWQSWYVSISEPSPISGFLQRRSKILIEINSIVCIFPSKQVELLQISGK